MRWQSFAYIVALTITAYFYTTLLSASIMLIRTVAQQLLGLDAASLIGQAAETVFTAWRDLVAHFHGATEAQVLIRLDKDTPRCLDLRIAPLHDLTGNITRHGYIRPWGDC